MTKEECIAELIAIADSGETPATALKRMVIVVDAYLAGRQNIATERQELAKEFRDRAPDTELTPHVLRKLAFWDR